MFAGVFIYFHWFSQTWIGFIVIELIVFWKSFTYLSVYAFRMNVDWFRPMSMHFHCFHGFPGFSICSWIFKVCINSRLCFWDSHGFALISMDFNSVLWIWLFLLMLLDIYVMFTDFHTFPWTLIDYYLFACLFIIDFHKLILGL